MSSLSKLSGIKSKPSETPETTKSEPEVKNTETTSTKRTSHDTEETSASVSSTTETLRTSQAGEPEALVVNKKTSKKKKQDKLVTVNIKIRKDQKDWLTDTASQVRDNNLNPVPPAERVYPQHLIGVAIDLLQNVDVDWGEVRNVEELREQLNL